jgi:RecB family exonuclease
MMMTPDQIVAALEPFQNQTQPTLILCASEATRQQVMRVLLAARPSWAGLRVQTLTSAARTLASQVLHPEETLEDMPEAHPWAERLQDRPLMSQQLADHVGVLHRMKALGLSIEGASEPLRLLVEAQWAVPDDLSGWIALLATNGPVIGVGFAGGAVGSGCGRLGAIEAHVLTKLGVSLVAPDSVDGIDAISVTDVASEARTAAALLSGCSDGLVLVADGETGQRVVATLRRNGIAVAADGATALKDHALVSVLQRLLPCFESEGVEPISARVVLDYLTHPVLSRRPIKRGSDAEEEKQEEAVDRSSVRHVRKLLRDTRRYHATVAEWLEQVSAQVGVVEGERAAESDDGRQEYWERYLGTIRIVQAHLQLLQDQSATGRLGGMSKLISARRLSSPSDRLGYAVQGALSSQSVSLATRENLQDALSGATSSTRVGDGITVLRYEEYDGRAVERLVLLDVHHKGLGKAPTHSPLLASVDLVCMGLSAPAVVVEERMALARWAASRAGRVHAVVTHADATGRRVVPPVQLKLREVDASAVVGVAEAGRYGHSLALPESALCDGLTTSVLGTPESQAVAQQISVEWVRAGYRDEAAEIHTAESDPQTLLDHIAVNDVRPDALRPWLGQTGPAKDSEDGLPANFKLSATSLENFTNCMYKAWGRSVLNFREPDSLDEDVSARELGTATHAVLESYVVGSQFELVVPAAQCDKKIAELSQECASMTEEKVRQAREQKAAHIETAAAKAARQGLTAQWRKHWEKYANDRIQSAADAVASHRKAVAKLIDEDDAKAVAAQMFPALSGSATGKLAKVMVSALAAEASLSGLRTGIAQVIESGDKKIGKTHGPIVQAAFAEEPSESLKQLIVAAEAVWSAPPDPAGDGLLIDSELKFGEDEKALLSLGRKPVQVRGSIDTIIRWKTTANTPTVEVVDFKTGSTASGGSPEQVLKQLTKPQLSFYALAVRAGLVSKAPDFPVSAVGYDLVKFKRNSIPVTDELLDWAHGVYGTLMDRARDGDYALVPHPQGCPLMGRSYCDFQEVCRMRSEGLPDHAEEEGGES